VDEWVLYLAPKLLGRDARPLVDLPAPASMAAARGFGIVDVTRIGEDVRLTLDPRRR
jgi:diaminohydroxyphosphoribosylaminopyrimidine deaminase/5-amino-6-(5-phosphoribosylamino)uracil reductase